jgi:Tfp pilus assembly protein FimT
MMIVLGIIAIVVAIALPRIAQMTLRQRTNRDAYIVAADLRSAFTSSARGRTPVRVSIPGDTTAYTLTNLGTGEKILQRSFASDKVPVAGKTKAALTIVVYPSGVATGIDTIVVGTSEFNRKISVSRVGFIRILP